MVEVHPLKFAKLFKSPLPSQKEKIVNLCMCEVPPPQVLPMASYGHSPAATRPLTIITKPSIHLPHDRNSWIHP